MKKHKFLFLSMIVIGAIILSISLANMVGGKGFYIFYNLIYGLLLSTILPVYFTYKSNEYEIFYDLGVRKIGIRQIVVLVAFVIFSIGGQCIPLIINSISIPFELLSLCIVPLIMTTFFEEFLFRGFMQTRLEKQYGWLPAILISGFFFSIYHLGYPGFRTISDLLLLLAVGIGFAVAFKLSNNNVIVSYFVNLPNAILTYLLKRDQFPVFDNFSTIIAGGTILLIILIFIFSYEKIRNRTT
ncbi:type II CAAX endopeptidase family protein [uncultured Clostridium sp.]|uniref:CPBP family intramembrane glutamic endopeptidase n=1 Tax=uncultured Clostridium sp. TaxID=59620 RepID=UPI0028F0AFA8|nr:type II CAAX endopeptidase family protein [uncultured Clostridium sp.]